jgi:hypothetical protein
MFFSGMGTELSPLQKRVAQGSPIYRAYPTGIPMAPRPNRSAFAPNLGRLFGHAGAPKGAELTVLQGLCGSGKTHHPHAQVPSAYRAEIEAIANGNGSSLVKRVAKKLAGTIQ